MKIYNFINYNLKIFNKFNKIFNSFKKKLEYNLLIIYFVNLYFINLIKDFNKNV